MGERYLIDTNSVSDYFGAKFPAKGMEFMHSVVNQTPLLSVMTRIELLGYVSPIIEQLRSFVGYDLTLITHNTSDFEGIPSLRIVDPYLLA
jgi:hypothetical protein